MSWRDGGRRGAGRRRAWRPGRRGPAVPGGGWRREWGPLLLVALVALPLFTPRIYASDEIKYFAHLRSVYFDGDLDYGNEYREFVQRDPEAHAGLREFAAARTATGRRLNDAPIGSAVLWAPFYVAADAAVAAARWAGSTVPRDGYSWPYVWAVCFGSMFWGTLGLFLSFRLARELADVSSARLAVLGVWFASPVVFYLYITPPMAHANSLFAVALFLFVWQLSRVDRTLSEWALLGLAGGLMVLVRELNWLLLAVVAVEQGFQLWEVVRRPSWRDARAGPASRRLRARLRQRMPGYLLFVAALGLVVTPQLLVYRALHGTLGPTPFVVRKFGWIPRHALEVLFSGFHGLFSWTPILLVAVLGLWWAVRRDRLTGVAFAVVFALQVAVIGAYDTWWGGAAFGARRFINCTPIFVVGLACFIEGLRPAVRRSMPWAVALLVLWNFGLAVQYSTGMIPRDEPVAMTTIARNQVREVAPRLAEIGWRFLTDRSTFTRTRP